MILTSYPRSFCFSLVFCFPLSFPESTQILLSVSNFTIASLKISNKFLTSYCEWFFWTTNTNWTKNNCLKWVCYFQMSLSQVSCLETGSPLVRHKNGDSSTTRQSMKILFVTLVWDFSSFYCILCWNHNYSISVELTEKLLQVCKCLMSNGGKVKPK